MTQDTTQHYTESQSYDKIKAIMHKTNMDAETIRNVLKCFEPANDPIQPHNYHMLVAATYEVERR